MTISELQKHALWADITVPQRKFLVAYIESNADKLKTGRALWKAKKDATTIDMVNRALRNPKIRKLLAVYHGASVGDAIFPMTKRELADLLASRIRAGGINASHLIRLTELFIYLRGWNPTALGNPLEKSSGSINDMVREMERNKARRRVHEE